MIDRLAQVRLVRAILKSPSLAAYTVMVAAYIGVVWCFRYIPTYDGPCHLASAVAWSELDNPESRYRRFYVFEPKQVPNITSQFLLAFLVRVSPPLVAEKIVVTIYLAGVAVAFWYFIGAFREDSRLLAPLGMAFLVNRAFLAGFYGYCLSLIAFWYVAGFCARHSQLAAREALLLASILFAVYFTHLVGWLLSVLAGICFVTASGSGQMRSLLRLCLAITPSAVLAIGYAADTSMAGRDGIVVAAVARNDDIASVLWEKVSALPESLFGPIDVDGGSLAWSVITVYLVLAVASFAAHGKSKDQRSTAGPVVALAAVLIVAYLLLPDHLGRHGGFLLRRLAFVPFMLIVPVLRLPSAFRPRLILQLLSYSVLAINLALVIGFFQAANADIREYVSGLKAVGTNAVIFTAAPPTEAYWPDYLKHAACYYCLCTGNVALENYQGEPGPFWMQLRPGISRGGGDFARYPNKSLVDFVLAWTDSAPEPRPPPGFDQVFKEGRLRVFAKRADKAEPRALQAGP